MWYISIITHKACAINSRYQIIVKLSIDCHKTKLQSISWFQYRHQPINVLTAEAQAFLMDYTQGERTITHHARPVRIGWC
jgi:hypothetical protein